MESFFKLDEDTQKSFLIKIRDALIKFNIRKHNEPVMPAECDPRHRCMLDKNALLQINMMIRHKIDPQQKERACKSLCLACESDKDVSFNLAVQAILAGADVNCKATGTNPAITIAATHNNVYICILLYLLGANLNTKNTFDFTALHYSVDRGNHLVTEVLLQLGADPQIASLCGLTPLEQLKRQNNSTETLKNLLEEYS